MAEMEGIKKEDALGAKRTATLDIESLQHKKYKTSELPISPEQQTSMQNMLVAFKKKGAFDSYRKKIWQDFHDMVSLQLPLWIYFYFYLFYLFFVLAHGLCIGLSNGYLCC